MSPIRRRAAALVGVLGALAIVAPVASASPATPLDAAFDPFAFAGVAAPITGWAGWTPAVGGAVYAHGGLSVGNVLNGGTTVVVSTGPAFGTVIASP
jgi:hypothetical protein